MRPFLRRVLPAFVQRRLLLSAARRALNAGRPDAALAILRDELLARDARAESLRLLALPLVPVPPPPPPPDPARSALPASGRDELRLLLKQMREQSASAEGGSATSNAAASAVLAAPAGPRERPRRLRMSLDDAGIFLVCAGEQAVIGHSRAGEADVPILGDLLPRHARIALEAASFHSGAGWKIEPLGAARVRVGETDVPAAGRILRSGEQIALGLHTTLRFEQPDSASLSCTLELEAGMEALLARRVLLFAPGAAGRLRIGAKSSRHVQAHLGGVELELVHDAGRLSIECASGLVPDEEQGSAPRTHFELPLALSRPLHLRLCMPTPAERPRWISFAPLEDA